MISVIICAVDGEHQVASLDSLSEKDLELIYTWKLRRNLYISVFGSMEGEAGQENKLELPPPVDNELLFGDVYIVCHEDEEPNNYKDLTLSLWEMYYEELFGGFESLGSEDSFTGDDEEEDEEEYDSDAYTKQGYLKDSFVVDDEDEEEEEEDNEGDY